MEFNGKRVSLAAHDWEVLEVSEAFRRFAGWDPAESFDQDRFDLDLVDKVEPSLPRDRPVALAGCGKTRSEARPSPTAGRCTSAGANWPTPTAN